MIVCHIGRWWLTAGKAGLLMNFPPSSEVLAVFCKTSRIGGLWRFSWKFGRALTATLSPKNLVCIPISPAPLPLLLPGEGEGEKWSFIVPTFYRGIGLRLIRFYLHHNDFPTHKWSFTKRSKTSLSGGRIEMSAAPAGAHSVSNLHFPKADALG